MNAIRATCFRPMGPTRLQRDTDWPRLPSWISFDRVVGVALDSRGYCYVAHRGDHPVLCLNPDGTFCREVGAELQRKSIAYDLRGPVPIPIATRYWMHGLHVDPWDNVWITEVSRHLVMKFSPAGELLLTLGVDGESGCDDQRFFQPTHVCVVPSGEFFVTDGYGNSRIAKFDARGKFLAEWGRRGTAPGEFHTPHVITVGADGLLYMTDRENDRVQVFDQAGGVRAVWPGLHSVDGLSAAPDGFIYGSGGIDNSVMRFDRTGKLLNVWAEPGAMCYPHAVVVGSDGSIYVAETGDAWIVTGDKPEDRTMVPREGAVGSRLSKFRVVPLSR